VGSCRAQSAEEAIPLQLLEKALEAAQDVPPLVESQMPPVYPAAASFSPSAEAAIAPQCKISELNGRTLGPAGPRSEFTPNPGTATAALPEGSTLAVLMFS
jgi:hypothetical protein